MMTMNALFLHGLLHSTVKQQKKMQHAIALLHLDRAGVNNQRHCPSILCNYMPICNYFSLFIRNCLVAKSGLTIQLAGATIDIIPDPPTRHWQLHADTAAQ